MNTAELYHHGIKGQRWGIRRYQKKDGTLTRAGLKRYGTVANLNKVLRAEAKAKKDAEKAKAKARTEAEIAKIRKKYKIGQNGKTDATTESNPKTNTKESSKPSTKPKTKTMSEMTDDEIRAKINRIQLENQLKSLQPQQVKKGSKFVGHIADVAIPAIKNAAKDSLEKYMKKALSKALGVDEKTTEDVSKQLAKEAQDLKNRVSIEGSKRTLNRYAQEAKEKSDKLKAEREAKEQNDKNTSDDSTNRNDSDINLGKRRTDTGESDTRTDTFTGKVHGEGTSSKKSDDTNSRNDDNIVDANFTEIVENPPAIINYGEDYIRKRFFG